MYCMDVVGSHFWFVRRFGSPLCCDASCLAILCRTSSFGASATLSMIEVGLVVLSAVGLIFVLTWWGRHDSREFSIGGVLPFLLLKSPSFRRR